MGDAGSMFIGFGLVFFSMNLSQLYHIVSPVVLLWVIAIPLFDLFNVILIRLGRGQSPFAPGCDHLHHILLQRGFSVRQVTSFLSLASFLIALLGMIGGYYLSWSDGWMFISFIGLFLVCLVLYMIFQYLNR